MQPNLKLECRELQTDSDSLEEFIRDDVARSMPLAYSVYENKNKRELNFLVRYLTMHRPYLTDIRFVNSEGMEPRYIRVSPTMDYQDPEVWDFVYGWLAEIFDRLRGTGNTCLITGFVLKKYIPQLVPSEYSGDVIIRGTDERIPVLLEWTEELKSQDAFGDVWQHGCRGYIVPSENLANLREWTKTNQLTPSLVEEFFSKVLCVFYAKYELEGIWVMSHVLDSKTICERIGVKEINEKIAQGIKAW